MKKSDSEAWFVFRRYTDFVALNEKVGLLPSAINNETNCRNSDIECIGNIVLILNKSNFSVCHLLLVMIKRSIS